MKVAVVGAGSWGTALAQVLAESDHDVRLWARNPALALEIGAARRNLRYLPDCQLSDAIDVTADLAAAVRDVELVIVAVPTHGMRQVASSLLGRIGGDCIVVSAAKGFELGTRMTMSALLGQVLGDTQPVAALSGPNIAPEIGRGLPAATVIAAANQDVADQIRDHLNGAQVRIYSSTDVIGVEYGAALKNIVAIAAGICDGIGAGDNGKAAIITRGLAEVARLGIRAGADPLTFAGLTGLGDCIVTCMSPVSRNRRLGEALGRGQTLAESTPANAVAEGINATRVAVELAAEWGVDMPIATQVHAVLFENRPIADALAELMARGATAEMRSLGLDRLDSPPPTAGSSSGG